MSATTDPSAEEARATCLWLAELATWRSGVMARLVTCFGSVEEVLERPRTELAAQLSRHRTSTVRQDQAAVDGHAAARPAAGGNDEGTAREGAAMRAALDRCRALRATQTPLGGVVVAYTDPAYPCALRDLSPAPPALFVLAGADGRVALERLERLGELARIAVVGTRRPSAYGLEMGQDLAADLARSRAAVISGLALGIDAAAHRGALDAVSCGDLPVEDGGGGAEAPPPCTVAVMAGGADVCYPMSHRALRQRVLDRGLIVSEFVWGAPVRAWRFVARNRVMAALSHAVVVVEGAHDSGALITARRAMDLGRTVLAVPGESGRRLTEGPHGLLREGAALCESGACVASALQNAAERDEKCVEPAVGRWLAHLEHGAAAASASTAAPHMEREPACLSPQEEATLSALDACPLGLDDIIADTGMSSAEVLAALGVLEVRGLVAVQGAGAYRAVRGPTRRRARTVEQAE